MAKKYSTYDLRAFWTGFGARMSKTRNTKYLIGVNNGKSGQSFRNGIAAADRSSRRFGARNPIKF